MAHVSDIKLIRTDTTLDLSQKAEKGIIVTSPWKADSNSNSSRLATGATLPLFASLTGVNIEPTCSVCISIQGNLIIPFLRDVVHGLCVAVSDGGGCRLRKRQWVVMKVGGGDGDGDGVW
ncbi:hypothetical protein R6Q59_033901 [Mikania micrantha]